MTTCSGSAACHRVWEGDTSGDGYDAWPKDVVCACQHTQSALSKLLPTFMLLLSLSHPCVPPHDTAPQEQKPLFSAEYLADRELNRTGSTPSDLKAALSASERKKNKSESRSRPGSVIKAHNPVDAKPFELQHNSGQHSEVELSRNSDPSEVSTSETVVGRVIVEDRPAQQAVQAKQQGHDVEAGLALERAGSGRGLALPFTPMSVAFKDISYFVPHPGVSPWSCAACLLQCLLEDYLGHSAHSSSKCAAALCPVW